MVDSRAPASDAGRRQVIAAAAIVGMLTVAACSADDGAAESTTAPTQTTTTVAPATTTAPTSSSAPATTTPDTTVAETSSPRQYDFDAVGPIVDAAIAEQGLDGAALVVVDRSDGVIHEQYWGEFDADRISLIASSSKMLAAGVLLRLADDGVLDLDAPVADAVDWGDGNPSITPAQLVSNSSGLVGLGPNFVYPPYLCQFLATGTLQDCGETVFTTTDDDADVIAPDTEFRYGGAQWQVAGALAEAVSGKSWSELIDDTYVGPCGLDSLAFNNHWTQLGLGLGHPEAFDPTSLDVTDNPNIEGGAYVTPRDYADLLLMLLRDGRCGDEQVLSPASVERMMTDRVAEAYTDPDAGPGYAMGWFVDRESGVRTDPGAFGSVPWLDLEAGHGAFLVVEARATIGSALAAELYEPVAEAVAAAG